MAYRHGELMCVDPRGIVHKVIGFRDAFTQCGWQRIWQEMQNGIWHNWRWRLVKCVHVTCIGCVANINPDSYDTPYRYPT